MILYNMSIFGITGIFGTRLIDLYFIYNSNKKLIK